MIKKIHFLVLLFVLPWFVQGQELILNKVYEEDSPVRTPFDGAFSIDGKTSVTYGAKTLEFVIQHRFGTMENGISDLWGVYGAANTRLAINYNITNWLQVGMGSAKFYKIQDLQWKLNLLKQTRNNTIPVSVAYYGNFAIDARNESNFGKNYSFTDRFAYFNEIIIGRKFTWWLSAEVGASFTHFNAVELGGEHDQIGLHFVGRVKFSPQSAIILNLDWPLNAEGIAENLPIREPAEPNFGFGYEVATSTHVFQVFFTTSNLISPQYTMMYNQNTKFIVGFNINRLWSF